MLQVVPIHALLDTSPATREPVSCGYVALILYVWTIASYVVQLIKSPLCRDDGGTRL